MRAALLEPNSLEAAMEKAGEYYEVLSDELAAVELEGALGVRVVGEDSRGRVEEAVRMLPRSVHLLRCLSYEEGCAAVVQEVLGDAVLGVLGEGVEKDELRSGLGLVWNLGLFGHDRDGLRRCGVLRALVGLLEEDGLEGMAAGALWNCLVENVAGCEEVAELGGVGKLLGLLGREVAVREKVIAALSNVAAYVPGVLGEIDVGDMLAVSQLDTHSGWQAEEFSWGVLLSVVREGEDGVGRFERAGGVSVGVRVLREKVGAVAREPVVEKVLDVLQIVGLESRRARDVVRLQGGVELLVGRVRKGEALALVALANCIFKAPASAERAREQGAVEVLVDWMERREERDLVLGSQLAGVVQNLTSTDPVSSEMFWELGMVDHLLTLITQHVAVAERQRRDGVGAVVGVEAEGNAAWAVASIGNIITAVPEAKPHLYHSPLHLSTLLSPLSFDPLSSAAKWATMTLHHLSHDCIPAATALAPLPLYLPLTTLLLHSPDPTAVREAASTLVATIPRVPQPPPEGYQDALHVIAQWDADADDHAPGREEAVQRVRREWGL